MVPLTYGVEDAVRYYNENDLIPGVEVKVVTFDTRYDPSRDIPAYDWVRGRGADIIMTPLSLTAEILKPFVEEDRVPLVSVSSTATLVEDPGWVFCKDTPQSYWIKTLLKWISEEHWEYQAEGRKPKIGSVGWNEPSHIDIEEGIKEYCDAHPDKFEYVGGYRPTIGTMIWGGEVEKLKNCDYVYPSGGIAAVSFVNQFRNGGYTATFIGCGTLLAFIGLTIDGCGWEKMDGTLTAGQLPFVEPMASIHELAKELLYENHSDEAEDIERSGTGYVGGFDNCYFALEILGAAIEEVGADDFDGQAFYDTAVNFSATYEGMPDWSFAGHETERWAFDYVRIWEWRAEARDIVMLSDWMLIEGVSG